MLLVTDNRPTDNPKGNPMQTGNHLPMLASIASGSTAGACSWTRSERRFGRGYKRGLTHPNRGLDAERRALKQTERAEWQADLADMLDLIDVRHPIVTGVVFTASPFDGPRAAGLSREDTELAAWFDIMGDDVPETAVPIFGDVLVWTDLHHSTFPTNYPEES